MPTCFFLMIINGTCTDSIQYRPRIRIHGRTVDARIHYWSELDLEPTKVDELNAPDLVSVSRSKYHSCYGAGHSCSLKLRRSYGPAVA